MWETPPCSQREPPDAIPFSAPRPCVPQNAACPRRTVRRSICRDAVLLRPPAKPSPTSQVRSSAGFQPAFRSRLEVCATTDHRAPHQHSPSVTHVLKLECYPCPDRTPHPISPFTILPSLFFRPLALPHLPLAPLARESLHYRPCCQPQHASARAKPDKLRSNFSARDAPFRWSPYVPDSRFP